MKNIILALILIGIKEQYGEQQESIKDKKKRLTLIYAYIIKNKL